MRVGRSYSVFSQRMLNQCLESLVQKIQSGVVINFEKTGPDPAEGKEVIVSVSIYTLQRDELPVQ